MGTWPKLWLEPADVRDNLGHHLRRRRHDSVEAEDGYLYPLGNSEREKDEDGATVRPSESSQIVAVSSYDPGNTSLPPGGNATAVSGRYTIAVDRLFDMARGGIPDLNCQHRRLFRALFGIAPCTDSKSSTGAAIRVVTTILRCFAKMV